MCSKTQRKIQKLGASAVIEVTTLIAIFLVIPIVILLATLIVIFLVILLAILLVILLVVILGILVICCVFLQTKPKLRRRAQDTGKIHNMFSILRSKDSQNGARVRNLS